MYKSSAHGIISYQPDGYIEVITAERAWIMRSVIILAIQKKHPCAMLVNLKPLDIIICVDDAEGGGDCK